MNSIHAQEECTFNADCPTNYSCVNGECIGEPSRTLRQQIVNCRANGSTCSLPTDCCSAICTNGTCSVTACRVTGSTCSLPTDCCSAICTNGICQTTGCRATGSACSLQTDCCSTFCTNGTCSATGCRATGLACSLPTDCCSGVCTNGTCSATACRANGSTCSLPTDCCSAICTNGTCSVTACRVTGSTCSLPTDCCSGLCTNSTCSATACRVTGSTCSLPTDCCSAICTNGICGGGSGAGECNREIQFFSETPNSSVNVSSIPGYTESLYNLPTTCPFTLSEFNRKYYQNGVRASVSTFVTSLNSDPSCIPCPPDVTTLAETYFSSGDGTALCNRLSQPDTQNCLIYALPIFPSHLPVQYLNPPNVRNKLTTKWPYWSDPQSRSANTTVFASSLQTKTTLGHSLPEIEVLRFDPISMSDKWFTYPIVEEANKLLTQGIIPNPIKALEDATNNNYCIKIDAMSMGSLPLTVVEKYADTGQNVPNAPQIMAFYYANLNTPFVFKLFSEATTSTTLDDAFTNTQTNWVNFAKKIYCSYPYLKDELIENNPIRSDWTLPTSLIRGLSSSNNSQRLYVILVSAQPKDDWEKFAWASNKALVNHVLKNYYGTPDSHFYDDLSDTTFNAILDDASQFQQSTNGNGKVQVVIFLQGHGEATSLEPGLSGDLMSFQDQQGALEHKMPDLNLTETDLKQKVKQKLLNPSTVVNNRVVIPIINYVYVIYNSCFSGAAAI